ncbi:MAG: acyltransferase [Lachnospiraceae bacterium]|uniref:acyltransferase n=1 Tax=Falcatimonas sp. MSJ-15 TaxID=2841515 RepID=UPI001C0FC55C|nr:acyltransferase [Falcatimonas sp. MSJ-15]MBQ5735054.1 acyltransferase [Lachnospiraceae bacterium]MBU5469504.1 acyltransferase [Falcatimonas sp. MSJ-15]MEE0959538.1 acyltransferase [Lachnospiraceae bacterium]
MLIEKLKNAYIWLYSIRINKKIFAKDIAKKCPLRIMPGTKIKGLYKGCIEIDTDNIYKGMIQFGMEQGSFGKRAKKQSVLMFEDNGKIVFTGRADFAATAEVTVYKDAVLRIDDGFFSNSNVVINVTKGVHIGKNAQIGWNVEIIDTDGHDICDMDGNKINYDKPVIIGDDVWIGARASILKGADIPDGCIIGYGSIVTKRFDEPHSIITGIPAKQIKNNITWRREKTI